MNITRHTIVVLACVVSLCNAYMSAQTIRAGGSLHFSIENAHRIPDELDRGKTLANRLYIDGTVDVEIIHHVLYAYTSFYTAGPGLEAGAFFYPVRKLPVYVNIGIGGADKENVPPFTVGLGGFAQIGEQSYLRWRFNGIGLTPSVSIGYAYSLYRDYDIPARDRNDFEMSGFDIPNVTARAQATYMRKGRDCDVQFLLNNTSQQPQRDVLIDVMFYGIATMPLEVRPVIASHVVPAGRVIVSDHVPIFGLVGNARELDVVSYGSFEQLDPKLLSKLGLKNLRKNDVETTITKFQLADDNVAEVKFEVKSNLEADVDGLIFRAELFDEKNNPLEVRYFSINDLFTQGAVVIPEMTAIHDANPKTKFIRCTPILYHEVDK